VSEIRYRYDDALAAIATRRFLSRYSRSTLIYSVALIVAVLFALQRTWIGVAVIAGLAAVYAALLLRYRRNARALARRLGYPEVTARADEHGMTFSMPQQQSTSGWTPARVLWQFDDVWLFFPYGVAAAYTAIPAAAMTPEFREIVLASMRANGATVR